MIKKEPGYVYILTNPSFREDWVKIGKSSRPIDIRFMGLDNTAVPLPFERYTTLKTVKYDEAEKLIHRLKEHNRFAKLKMISQTSSSGLGLANLLEHGMNTAPHGALKPLTSRLYGTTQTHRG